jgi:hypothetical protein
MPPFSHPASGRRECKIILDPPCNKLHVAVMSDIDEILARAKRYADRRKLKPSTVSRILFGNGTRLGQIERGGSLRVDTLHKVLAKLDELEAA